MIDLPTIQKKLNLHYTLSLDLFGSEVSTNAANAFNAGIKGRYHGEPDRRRSPAHRCHLSGAGASSDGKLVTQVDVPALTAINMRLRDDYTRDAAGGVGRWNKIIEKAGVDFELKLPHDAFHRKIGVFADKLFDPDGDARVRAQTTTRARMTGCRPMPMAISSSH